MYQSNYLQKTLQEKIEEDIKREMDPIINDSFFQNPSSFFEWLFNFVDYKKESQISMNDFVHLLDILKNDGIDLTNLIYEDVSSDKIYETLFKEYSKDGFIKKQEFLKLSNYITCLYERYQVERKEIYKINEWFVSHQLGKGGFGKVLAVTNKNFEKKAIKIIKKRKEVSSMCKLDSEIQAMKLLSHENILKLTDVMEDESDIYLVMEMCGGGSLYEVIKDAPLNESVARFYFSKLLDGLSYCHSKGVCHRDLRLENILLDSYGNLKIADFGHSRIFSPGWDLFQTQMIGSLFHLSPEQIHGKIYSGEKIDVWSCGIILYTLLTQLLPFCSSDPQEMFQDIVNGKFEYPKEIELSNEAKTLINSLLQVDPDKRPSVKDILSSEWMKMDKEEPKFNIIKKTLQLERFDQFKQKVMKVFSYLQIHYSPLQDNVLYCVYIIHGIKFKITMDWTESEKKLNVEFSLLKGEMREFRKFIKTLEKELDQN